MTNDLVLGIEIVGKKYSVIAKNLSKTRLVFIPMIQVIEKHPEGENVTFAWPNVYLQAPHGGLEIYSGVYHHVPTSVIASHIFFDNAKAGIKTAKRRPKKII